MMDFILMFGAVWLGLVFVPYLVMQWWQRRKERRGVR